jgi:hypothetical protein
MTGLDGCGKYRPHRDSIPGPSRPWRVDIPPALQIQSDINPLNAELNPICRLLALLGGATVVVVSRLRVNTFREGPSFADTGRTDRPISRARRNKIFSLQ